MGKVKYTISAIAMLLATPVLGQDWSGSWTGLSLGYGDGSYLQGDFDVGQPGVDVDVQGIILGLHYEWNHQRGNQVLGFDLGLSNGIAGSRPLGTGGPNWSCLLGDCNVAVTSLLTLRGRYGWLLAPETLVYGAGGLAAGQVEGGIRNSFQQGSSTAVGYTVGAGLAHMLQPDIVVYAEINHVDLGTLEFGWGDTPDDTLDGKGDFRTVLVGVNFRF